MNSGAPTCVRNLFGYPDSAFPTVSDWTEKTNVHAEHHSQTHDRWQKL
ncbi:hypothetical protein ABFT80_23680 [Mesorhizobium sp. SB112]